MDNIQEKYRAVFFDSTFGHEVLEDILTMCHLGRPLDHDNPAHAAQHNISVIILNKCGVFGNKTAPQLINAFASIIPEGEQEKEK